MSEKKWSLKDNMESSWLRFSRRMMNEYEGTHLGMSRRWTHKSGPMSTGFIKKHWRNYGIIPRKYIIGLLNKFIEKSFDDFVNEYNHKIQDFKGVNTDDYLKYISINESDDKQFHSKFNRNYYYFENQLYKPYGGHKPYYVDENGLIQKTNIDSKFTKKKGFNSIQLSYNSKLYIPKFNDVKTYNDSHYRNTYSLKTEFLEPVYFFDGYIKIKEKVVKVPLYGCIEPLYVSYNNYCHNHENGIGFYYKNGYSKDLFATNNPKGKIIEENWVGISSSNMPRIKREQHYHKYVENTKWNELNNKINKLKENNEDTSEFDKRLKITPRYIYQDLGFGSNICYFIKRSDYEKAI